MVGTEKQVPEFFSQKETVFFSSSPPSGFVDKAVALFTHLSQPENLSLTLSPRMTPRPDYRPISRVKLRIFPVS